MKSLLERSLRSTSVILTLFLFAFLFASIISAKTPEEIAKDHGITFPIEQLGGCTNVSACRAYCDDPTHSQACADFAKSKGFNGENESNPNDQNLLAAAKAELGCDSLDSCSIFCRKEANYDKCSAFAQKHNLSGGQVADPGQKDLLEKAKEVLGCDSPATCSAFCSKRENYQKCSNFAKQVGLRGGQTRTGPGGCNSEDTCRAFCSDPNNYQICSSYGSAVSGKFSGPGGCNSQDSCQTYCQQHQDQCGGHGQNQNSTGGNTNTVNYTDLCNQTPNCAWTNNTCNCTRSENVNPEDYCKKFPTRCYNGNNNSTGNQNTPPTGNPIGNPSDYCRSKPGCNWTNDTCQCSGANTSPSNNPTSNPTTNPSTSPSGNSINPSDYCQKNGCTWTGSTCQCTGTVHGANTTRGLLETILDLVRSLLK